MGKKYLIIIAFAIVFIGFGAISVSFHKNIRYNQNRSSILEEKVREYKTQLNELKDAFEYYVNNYRDPFYEDYKKRISGVIERDISKIVSAEPWTGGQWYVTDITFVDPSLVRVEIEDGHFRSISHIRIIWPDENILFEEVSQ